jgi:hypothetical protein
MKKILIDTNFLLIPAQFKVDIFTEIDRIIDESYKLYILDKSIDELDTIIENQKGKNKEAALLAKKLIQAHKLNIVKTDTEKYPDDIITDEQDQYLIATQDINLKKRLKKPIITLRQKKYLILG